jgi:enoyl-CoA hydratase
MSQNFETLTFECDEEGICQVTINRPDKLNALNAQVLDDLESCFNQIEVDDRVRGVIITGSGEKSFVAGADIRKFKDLDAESGYRFALRGQAVFNQIERLGKPVIAAVNGYALGGGCELAMACHLRTASDNARFGQPEVNLGILPGYGGTQRLPKLVGRGRAMELILTGVQIDANRAFEIGLVNLVTSSDELIDSTSDLLRTILSKAPTAVALSIEALRMSDLDIDQGLEFEAAQFGQACGTNDFQEGVDAFLERRKPEFKGS